MDWVVSSLLDAILAASYGEIHFRHRKPTRSVRSACVTWLAGGALRDLWRQPTLTEFNVKRLSHRRSIRLAGRAGPPFCPPILHSGRPARQPVARPAGAGRKKNSPPRSGRQQPGQPGLRPERRGKKLGKRTNRSVRGRTGGGDDAIPGHRRPCRIEAVRPQTRFGYASIISPRASDRQTGKSRSSVDGAATIRPYSSLITWSATSKYRSSWLTAMIVFPSAFSCGSNCR